MSVEDFQWCDYLSVIQWAYNISVHPGTGVSPFKLMYGFEPTLPVDLLRDLDICEMEFGLNDIQNMVTEMDLCRKEFEGVVLDKAQREQSRQKEYYDSLHLDPSVLKVGVEVMLHVPKSQRSLSKEFRDKWIGPYRIIEVVSQNLYRLCHIETKEVYPKVVSLRYLKLFSVMGNEENVSRNDSNYESFYDFVMNN